MDDEDRKKDLKKKLREAKLRARQGGSHNKTEAMHRGDAEKKILELAESNPELFGFATSMLKDPSQMTKALSSLTSGASSTPSTVPIQVSQDEEEEGLPPCHIEK